MLAKYRPTFLILLALLSAMTLPGCTFGQQTAKDFLNRGKAEMAKGDLAGANEDFAQTSKIIQIEKDFLNWNANDNHANLKNAKPNWDGAIANYSKAIELNAKDARAYQARGYAKYNKGDLDGAIADYTKAIKLNSEYADAYNNRGVAKKAKGNQAGADKDFAQAAKFRGR